MPLASQRPSVTQTLTWQGRNSRFLPEEVPAGPVKLRRVRAGDAGAIAAAVRTSLDHLSPWMSWATPEAADRRVQLAGAAESDELWEAGYAFNYSILDTRDGTLVGTIGLNRGLTPGSAEIGYWIAVDRTRRGYGTAAVRALTQQAAGLAGVTRVEIHCDEANVASAAIPRKLGYRLDRVDPHEREAPGERGRRMIWVWDPAAGAEGQAP
jgi:RimJ/RimL family protein N-acetyltransferase